MNSIKEISQSVKDLEEFFMRVLIDNEKTVEDDNKDLLDELHESFEKLTLAIDNRITLFERQWQAKLKEYIDVTQKVTGLLMGQGIRPSSNHEPDFDHFRD